MNRLVIIDIVSNNYEEFEKTFTPIGSDTVLALTPSSFFYLEQKRIQYLSFHDLISRENFRELLLDFYDEMFKANKENIYVKSLFREIAQSISTLYFIEAIIDHIKTQKYDELYYITDKQQGNSLLSNHEYLLDKYIDFTQIMTIGFTEKRQNITYSFSTIIEKIYRRIFFHNRNYDWKYIPHTFIHKKIFPKQTHIKIPIPQAKLKYLKYDELSFHLRDQNVTIKSLASSLNAEQCINLAEYKKQNYPLYFFQHGSYFYHLYFKNICNFNLKYFEIDPADINFVFNDYTKKIFENLNAKRVYSVGSILFNKPIKEKQKEYDYLYIIQGHDYLGNLQYVDFPNSLHSFDGYELYMRHKAIIELFGNKFKDKKILIRAHPAIMTIGLYVPLWELAEPYPNVTINASTTVHILIEKSKYIISDYFTSEFINREIHYKKDIILFHGAPTPLPEETIDDMKKMFILVETVNDLKETINSIDVIAHNRIRYDDIIEYYSSKKCDTKAIVTEILKNEFHGR